MYITTEETAFSTISCPCLQLLAITDKNIKELAKCSLNTQNQLMDVLFTQTMKSICINMALWMLLLLLTLHSLTSLAQNNYLSHKVTLSQHAECQATLSLNMTGEGFMKRIVQCSHDLQVRHASKQSV
jgi:uncharacterized membrane protein YjgN (DUF898 family)